MTVANRPARLNRGVLGILGLILVAGGAAVLAVHLGAVDQVDPSAALVPGTDDPPRWVQFVVLAVAVVVALAALRWLAAQFGRLPKHETWRLGGPGERGDTVLGSGAAAAAVADDVTAYPGVRAVTARLTGGPAAPDLHLVVEVEPEADLPELRRRIRDHALVRLCSALELTAVPVSAEFRIADRARAGRTR
ncbi:alkaline shock response membrane anchor protein AmaP [Nocardia rhizosphaerae]|uniref:Alkaline shock response membrane anchor protein AmaP n=1 Tax=Nocardia rhizosphaerae TaxID=1691571 RepID=A0ABV8LAD1_9NOCA